MGHCTRASKASIAVLAVCAVLAAALVIPVGVRAQEREAAGPASRPAMGERGMGERGAGERGMPAARGARGAAPINLEREMSAMDRAFKALQGQIKDKTRNAASLTLVTQLQVATVNSKQAAPPMVNRAPEADRPKMAAEYRSMMLNLLREELDLEEELLKDDNAKAADTLASIDEIQKQGHKEYRPPAGAGAGD
jgi:hypothetical protein